MKKNLILWIIVLALLAAALSIVLGRAAVPPLPADDPAAAPQATEEAASVIPEPTAESTATAAVPTAEAFADNYFRVVTSFHPGTAGSSLGRAWAACAAVHFANENRIAQTDIPLLRSTMLAAWESLSDDERAWFDENFIGLAEEIEACRTDWESNRALFEDAGVADQMAILMDMPAALEHWDTLRAHTLTLGNSEG